MSFSEEVHVKGSKEAGETMVEFNKYTNKEGMFEECSKMTLSGTVSKQCVLRSGGKCVVEAFLYSGKSRSVHSLLQLLQVLERGTGQLTALS
jgi:hypothetical protein